MTGQQGVSGERRILALDLGRKRIGLAVSDELGITAQGLETLLNRAENGGGDTHRCGGLAKPRAYGVGASGAAERECDDGRRNRQPRGPVLDRAARAGGASGTERTRREQ